MIYLGSGPYHPHDLSKQVEKLGSQLKVVMVDIQVGGKTHDILRRPVANAVAQAAADSRCVGMVVSIRCKTWSVATAYPDGEGKPGKPYRNITHPLGIPDEKGHSIQPWWKLT